MHPKSFVGRAPPGPAGGAYSAPPYTLAGFRALLLRKGRGGQERVRGKGKGGEGKGEGKGREGKGTGGAWACPRYR